MQGGINKQRDSEPTKERRIRKNERIRKKEAVR